MTPQLHHITHPLIQHKLTLMREKDRSTSGFRTLMNELSMLMAYEVTRDMPTQLVEIETPLEKMMSPVIDGKKTVFVSILRAGNGFLDGMLNVVPGARVGHVGLYRDPARRSKRQSNTISSCPRTIQERDVDHRWTRCWRPATPPPLPRSIGSRPVGPKLDSLRLPAGERRRALRNMA